MNLNNRRILLTGAAGGIGGAVAQALSLKGANLLLVGRNEQVLDPLAQKLVGEHQVVIADITTSEGLKHIVEECRQSGGIDLMINLAGVLDFQFFDQQSESCIEQTLFTNLLAPMLLCNKLIPLLKQKTEAAIVNVGSTFGSIGHPGFATYCASKFGLRGFTEALSRELADTKIKVFYLAPRATATGFNSDAITELNHELGNKIDSPEWVASELVTLLDSNKHQRYLGWPEKIFVRLNALFPEIVHNALIKKISIIRKHAEQ